MEPPQANVYGTVHGGEIMKLVDTAAGSAAIKHAGRICVTASVDRMDFIAPVHVGEFLHVRASVNYVHRTSMEVGVRVDAEVLVTGSTRHVASAYVILVALDEAGRHVTVPALLAESDDERRRMAAGAERYRLRREQRTRAAR
ncbi:acyl-CoA thioesterase [bacterium]|nr:MAG: acyl-CoA thioesterase [bacterium]